MCCQSGERRSGLSLLPLTSNTALSHTSAGMDGRSGSTRNKHGDVKQVLQLVLMRRNGYENSNQSPAKASLRSTGSIQRL